LLSRGVSEDVTIKDTIGGGRRSEDVSGDENGTRGIRGMFEIKRTSTTTQKRKKR
jgi:hypothetical protein